MDPTLSRQHPISLLRTVAERIGLIRLGPLLHVLLLLLVRLSHDLGVTWFLPRQVLIKEKVRLGD